MHSSAPGPVQLSPGPAPPSPTQLASQGRHSVPRAYSPLAHMSGWGHAMGQVVHSSALGPEHVSQLSSQLRQVEAEGAGEGDGVMPPPHAQHMTLAVKSSSSYMVADASHTAGVSSAPHAYAVGVGTQRSQPVFGPGLSQPSKRTQCEFPGAQVISVHRSMLLSQEALHAAKDFVPS